MVRELFRLSFTIAITRLVALTMPVADVILLAHFSPNSLAAYAIGAQWAQIGIVACGALGVAITVVVPRCITARRTSWLAPILATAVAWGAVASVITLVIARIPTSFESSALVTVTLALGLLPLCVYASLSSYSQSLGRSKLILRLTVLAGLINGALDIVFIRSAEPAIGVATATVVCWSMLCGAILCLTFRRKNRSVACGHSGRKVLCLQSLMRHWRSAKSLRLYRVALPDFLSRFWFVGAVAVGLWWLSTSIPEEALRILAATLNYMNVVSVVLAAVTTAFSIAFLQQDAKRNVALFTTYAIAALALIGLLFLSTSPLTSQLYFNELNRSLLYALTLATLVVLVDGIALFSITLLRINGVFARSPYLRLLMFPCAGLYFVFVKPTSAHITIQAMLAGNSIVAICTVVVCCLLIRRHQT